MTPAELRARMVARQLIARGITDPRILAAFARVPRERFVPGDQLAHAYDDMPLPIGEGQTISQPYVVALTIEALRLPANAKVLEIGTGSGYAAAILGTIAREVVTIERIGALAEVAAARLAAMELSNVEVHHADGSLGWPARAPYDGIAVAAGAPRPPASLLAQLAIGGRLVLPTGSLDEQHLLWLERRDEHTYVERDLGEVRFVPLVGAEGWPG
ncbi:MAG: protein-L-isoaspartate(D-aspartate) O-methyltransferase [Deltaproteobacteria bacterium]|nr:protein-L-isoaspartate(D-aspartate) O-methyltransferase [Deltaproteobacteria bacterium]